MTRKLALMTMVILLSVGSTPSAQAAPDFLGKRWFQSPVYYYLDSTITQHSSWPGFISTYSDKWRSVESSVPYRGRSYNQSTSQLTLQTNNLGAGTCAEAYTGSVDEGRRDASGRSVRSMKFGYVEYSSSKVFNTSGRSNTTCDFYWTTMHEFGHIFGLGHDTRSDQVMTRYNTGYHYLRSSDISGMRSIY